MLTPYRFEAVRWARSGESTYTAKDVVIDVASTRPLSTCCEEGIAMRQVGKPVPTAISQDLMASIATNQQSRLLDAMWTETLFGDVDHGVALGAS